LPCLSLHDALPIFRALPDVGHHGANRYANVVCRPDDVILWSETHSDGIARRRPPGLSRTCGVLVFGHVTPPRFRVIRTGLVHVSCNRSIYSAVGGVGLLRVGFAHILVFSTVHLIGCLKYCGKRHAIWASLVILVTRISFGVKYFPRIARLLGDKGIAVTIIPAVLYGTGCNRNFLVKHSLSYRLRLVVAGVKICVSILQAPRSPSR